MAKGTLITFDPDGKRSDHRVDRLAGPNNEEIQKAIGGGYYIPVEVMFEGKKRVAYVDEDGSPKKMVVNPYATSYMQAAHPHGKTVSLRGPIAIWLPDDPVRPPLRTRKKPKHDPLADLLRRVGGELVQLADDIEQERPSEVSLYAVEAQTAIYSHYVNEEHRKAKEEEVKAKG